MMIYLFVEQRMGTWIKISRNKSKKAPAKESNVSIIWPAIHYRWFFGFCIHCCQVSYLEFKRNTQYLNKVNYSGIFFVRSFLPLVFAQLLIQFQVQPIVEKPINSNLTAYNGSAIMNEIQKNEPFINRNVRSVPAPDDVFNESALNGIINLQRCFI